MTFLSDEAQRIMKMYDYEPREEQPPFANIPPIDEWQVCCLLGQSGTGKTTSLKRFGDPSDVDVPNDIAVIDVLPDVEATARMFRKCGFNSIPSWCLPYHKLSNGEQYRVQIALKYLRGDNPIILDEFGSYLDEMSAMYLADIVKKFSAERKFLIATLNPALADNLKPATVIELGTPQIRRLVRRDRVLRVQRCHRDAWEIFKKHHYMSSSLITAAKCFLFTIDGEIAGFTAAIPLPSGTLKDAYRGHRTVVLPNFQGCGLGVAIADTTASIAKANGKLYYTKTVHPSLGEYREMSPKWKASAKNKRMLNPKGGHKHFKWDTLTRVSYAHQYIGDEADEEMALLWNDDPPKEVHYTTQIVLSI